ncbi:nicotinate-nucleotide--dimethylbenzimidazole phosphoribosyltransferase [Hydrogenophaga palleronii]|uniref:Nicotinate-nucleotide--dimethylbenzimidazole phosphoribosyltransferase n=1 Tax=Hydrogenophaga palleronii TaxID=65655 RepID=A0ABU1WNY4_9BURK|nr:nicotinate-nucleotide--dimethylbenzimidazole phosphoribosyltransferase [Hydrogenophaga palleronii]
MNIQPFPSPASVQPSVTSSGLKLPEVEPTADIHLDHALRGRVTPEGFPEHALGRMEALVLQLGRIQHAPPTPFDALAFESPQMLVFAADHGIADEGVSAFPQAVTSQRVTQILAGRAPVNALSKLHGFELTVIDAGLANPLTPPDLDLGQVPLLLRKIGYGTRNMVLSPAMSLTQAVAALHAGMDVVRHLPGNVVALGDVGVGNTSCAALLLSRLCGVPLADACGRDHEQEGGLADTERRHKLEKLFEAATRHRKAVSPLAALAAMGGFEIAMMAGAMVQAASERRIVLVDGFVSGTAALVARSLRPAVADYLIYSHRSAEPGHRLLLIHLQAQPLMDMELRVGQGVGALLAWPLLLAARDLLAPQS